MKFKAEKFKVITLSDNGDEYIIPTVNATSIITSIKLNEITEKLESLYDKYKNLSDELKKTSERVDFLYHSFNENKDKETELKLKKEIENSKECTRLLDFTVREITKTTFEIIKNTVKDFESHKEFIYSIPDEKQNEFIIYLRIASLGGEQESNLDEKKIENFLESITSTS